jgi:hypothetical protein
MASTMESSGDCVDCGCRLLILGAPPLLGPHSCPNLQPFVHFRDLLIPRSLQSFCGRWSTSLSTSATTKLYLEHSIHSTLLLAIDSHCLKFDLRLCQQRQRYF